MLIDEIVSKIDDGGPGRYYSFETFMLNLLKHHIEEQQKKLEIHSNIRNSYWDAIAPDGFDEFLGETAIEIKFNSNIPARVLVEKLFNRNCNETTVNATKNLIVIFAKPLNDIFKDRFNKEIKNSNLPFKVFLWGPEEINVIVNKNRKISNKIVNNLFSLRLESEVSKPKTNWKTDRDDILERIKRQYSKGQFAVFLGAGVSSSAGIPDWNTLLNSLFVAYLTKEFDGDTAVSDKDINELVFRLNTIDEPSALMAARYLRKGLAKNKTEVKEFTEAITKNLYKLRDTSKLIDSSLLKSITAMCMPKRTGAKIKSVVTYNFDDLLERQLSKNTIQHRSIYTENDSYDPDELPVYHVHGFLPENRKNYESLEKSTLVFSEEGYHQIYSQAYHWSNLVQLNNLRENNCLMIGLSMTDPNLRRLLDISARNTENPKHFALMKRIATDYFCFENDKSCNKKKQIISSVTGAEEFLDRHHLLNEALMRELGVTIVWYEEYDEIPKLLEKIMNLTMG